MILQKVTKAYPLLFRHQRYEIEFDLVRIGVLCESQSLRETHHVGVDADGLLTEAIAEHDVGCFAPHAGEAKKVF